RRPRLRPGGGDLPHQRDDGGVGIAWAAPGPAPRPVPRVGARHLRTLPAPGRRAASGAVPAPAAAAASRLVAGAHVRVGRGGARAGRGLVRRGGRARRGTVHSTGAGGGSGGADGLDVARLIARLQAAEASGEAVLLAGPSAGFVRLFDTAPAFRLGPGSRLMDTGGSKGMSRPLSRAGFLRACWTQLAVAGYFCVNEYGMTELCSQRYQSVLRDRFSGRSLDARRLVAPPWLRTRVLDPDTLAPVPAGDVGLLCHHDLANAGSVSVVLTEDLGRQVGDEGIEGG